VSLDQFTDQITTRLGSEGQVDRGRVGLRLIGELECLIYIVAVGYQEPRRSVYYERSDREFAVSLPPRDYRLAAELLARAADADSTGVVRTALEAAAADLGRELATRTATPGSALVEHLTTQGFEPYHDGEMDSAAQLPIPPARPGAHGADLRDEPGDARRGQ
jgi:hypothetical protein